MLHPNCHGLLQLHNFNSLDLTWIQVNPPTGCFRPEYLALCFIQTAMVFFNCTYSPWLCLIFSEKQKKSIPLSKLMLQYVSQFTSPPLSRLLQSSQVTTLCISHDHMTTYPWSLFLRGSYLEKSFECTSSLSPIFSLSIIMNLTHHFLPLTL